MLLLVLAHGGASSKEPTTVGTAVCSDPMNVVVEVDDVLFPLPLPVSDRLLKVLLHLRLESH